MKPFNLKKKKLIIYNNCVNLGSFLKMQHVFDTSIFSLKYVKNIGSFNKALHFLQFDIFNTE